MYCEFEPPLGHFPFLCTANEFNNCKSGRGWRSWRSVTASSGLHLHFWHMCKVHPDQTLFTVYKDHRNCLHHVENVLNWLLPRTKFLCKTLWKGYVLPPCAEQQPELCFLIMSDLEDIKTSYPDLFFNQAGKSLVIADKLFSAKTVLLGMSLLGIAQQDLQEVSQVRNQKEVRICSVEEACTNRQCKWTRAHDAFQPSYLLGSARVCPSFSHMCAQSHSCPEHYTLQHLLVTKEGAVYTYFYSSIKRWPANKKKIKHI